MKYWLIRSDGSSLFEQAYERDFLLHCLVLLLDHEEASHYYLCSEFAQTSLSFPISLARLYILD